MENLVQQVLAGLTSGAIYASLGLAIVMIYRATGHLNFAQGELATFSTFIALSLITLGVPYWLTLPMTLAISFFGGAFLWSHVVKPIGSISRAAPIAALIGVFLIVNSLSGLIWGHDTQAYPSPFEEWRWLSNTYFSAHECGVILMIGLVSLVLHMFFRFTRAGLAMRACAENPSSSHLVGIPVERLLSIGWGISTALGALAGILVAPIIYLDPNMMGGVLIYGFAAALLGGITSPVGALAGGVIIGVAENLIGFYLIGTEIKLSIALMLIIATLLFKPAGLFGKTISTRV
ncbi:branched-chain amino acid ABC transporter permease [Variovorax sp. YR752]|uniref:branched-chain amino acid ABC transporter permease n=1 Tax=Variovorax sp. YR752 TaxID=1884383 RepID=UPI00313846D0